MLTSTRQFRFVKHFFWFSEEPLNKETLDAYVKSEKADVAHHHAAWAQETGKGVLFYAKRAEDKNAPAGLIVLVRPYYETTTYPMLTHYRPRLVVSPRLVRLISRSRLVITPTNSKLHRRQSETAGSLPSRRLLRSQKT